MALLTAPLLTLMPLALSSLTLAFGVFFAVDVADDVAWRGSELVVAEASVGSLPARVAVAEGVFSPLSNSAWDRRRPCTRCSLLVDDGLQTQTLQGKATSSRALLRPRPLLSWSSVCRSPRRCWSASPFALV